MINSLSSTNANGEIITLKIREVDPETGLLLVKAEGLGSLTANVNTVGGPGYQGSEINSANIDKRNIVLTLAPRGQGLEEEDARHDVYKYFSVGEEITIGAKSLTRNATIKGVVESVEMVMFNSIENAKVSVICPKVWWKSKKAGSLQVSGTIPRFTFPFSNPSLTDPKLIFGEELVYVNKSFENEGEYSTGMTINISLAGPVGNIFIYNTSYRHMMELDTTMLGNIIGRPLDQGDMIVVESRVGEKGMYIVHNGLTTDATNALEKDPDWLYFYPGWNNFAFTAETGVDNVSVNIDYDILFKGM